MYPRINLKFPSSAATTLTSVSATNEANVSNYDQVFAANNGSRRKAGFQVSSTKTAWFSTLNGSFEFFGSSGYPGFLSVYSNQASVSFKIDGDIPDSLYVTFDLATGQFPPSFQIKNVTKNITQSRTGTSLVTQVSLSGLNVSSGDTLSIILNSWSVPFISRKLTAVATDLIIQLSGASLVNFKCSENMMNSDLSIAPGICEQYANISLYDRSKLIHRRAEKDQLNEDIDVVVQVVDDNGNEQIIGTYVSSEWNIDSNNSVIDLVCRDKSYLFEKINIERADIANRSIDNLLNILFNQAPGMPWIYADAETQTRCQNITLPDSWYLASNLYEMLDKICSIGMLRIYWYVDTFIVGRCI